MDNKKELKLIFDLKYGYADAYIAIKSYCFYLDILSDKQVIAQMQSVAKSMNIDCDFKYHDPETLLAKYESNPEQIIKDYALLPLINNFLLEDIARGSFPEVFEKDGPCNFPELFIIRNIKLEYSEDSEYEDIFEIDQDFEQLDINASEHKYDA